MFSACVHSLLLRTISPHSASSWNHDQQVFILYCSTPTPHTVSPPEITTDKCSVRVHSTSLLKTAFSYGAYSWSYNRQVFSACALCCSTLLSHTASPELTRDKCSVHVHSAAPLHTAFSCSISWTQNRQMFIACALYCSTLHRFLTQPLLNSQQTSVQCMHSLLLHLTPHYATSVSTHTHTHTHKYIHKYAHGHIHTQIHAHHTHKHLVVVT